MRKRKAVQWNDESFPSCLTKQKAVLAPALRGIQSNSISALVIFARQPA